jgi:hypothetical protein
VQNELKMVENEVVIVRSKVPNLFTLFAGPWFMRAVYLKTGQNKRHIT